MTWLQNVAVVSVWSTIDLFPLQALSVLGSDVFQTDIEEKCNCIMHQLPLLKKEVYFGILQKIIYFKRYLQV